MPELLAGIWLLWCVFNTALMLAAPLLTSKYAGPYTNGVRIFIPDWMRRNLTAAEVDAIAAHERGHIARLHPWLNLARACFFLGRSEERRRDQELEADDYAAQHASAIALASALRKFSVNEFDHFRATRLEDMAR